MTGGDRCATRPPAGNALTATERLADPPRGDRPRTAGLQPTVSVQLAGDTADIVLTGELDYDSSVRLVEVATGILREQPGLAELHLDFAAVTSFDTTALADVLLISRRAASAGVQLHLDNRPAFVDRTLDITGTREHLTAETRRVAPTQPDETTTIEQQSL